MTTRQADLLLLLSIGARSVSYLFSKIGLATLQPWDLLGFRFAIAFAILCIIFHSKLNHIPFKTWIASLALGVVLFLCMSLEAISLQTIDSSMSAFLENTAVLWVFVIQAIYTRTLPQRAVLIALPCMIGGIFLLTLHGSTISLSAGMLLGLAGSVCYAVWIILTGKYAHDQNPLHLGILQMGVIMLLSFVCSAVTGTIRIPSSPSEWEIILALALICSVIGFTLQPIAQKYTSAEKAGLFTPLNPVIAFLLGWAILAEEPGISQFCGGLLIAGSILFIQLHKNRTPALQQA